MNRWSTKDHYEREQQDTERLVRNSPKDKPARRDLRRERVETEKDPDSTDPSDEKDRSKNYKVIGGSENRVPAKNLETGAIVHVSPETLISERSKYKAVDPEEVDGDANAKFKALGKALRELASDDPKLLSKLKDFTSPGSHLHGFVRENPNFPASKIFQGVTLPDGISTIGDVHKALQNSSPVSEDSKPKKPKKPKPESEEKAPDSSKSEEKASEPPSEESKSEEKASEPPSEESNSEEKASDSSEPEEKANLSGIFQKVKRRPVTEFERMEAASLITDSLPAEDAAQILAIEDLHPDDAKNFVRNYLSAKEGQKAKNLDSFVGKVSKFYNDGSKETSPPTRGARGGLGKIVPFETLTEDDKAEATLKNHLEVVALSLAAKALVKERLMDVRILTGKPRIPEEIASKISTAMLTKSVADSDIGVTSFNDFLDSGYDTKVDEVTAKKLLSRTKSSPSGTAIAKAFLQANDYGLAKSKFLRGDDESISEWQTPEQILKGLKKAGKFFSERNSWYGGVEDHPASGFFRMRVLKRLKTLDPTKARAVTSSLPDLEREEYQEKLEAWKKARQDWVKNPDGPQPIKPPPPVKSPDKTLGNKLWATRFRKQSSYLSGHVMTSGKFAVYNGVEPYAYGPEKYTKFSQPLVVDEAAEKEILSLAKDRLGSSVLSEDITGMLDDVRYRAALDLAIYESRYNGRVGPNQYNSLLARLSGNASEPGVRVATDTPSYNLNVRTFKVKGPSVSEALISEVLSKIRLSYKDLTGTVHTDGFAKIRQASVGNSEVTFVGEFPEGSGVGLYKGLQAALGPLGLTLEAKAVGYQDLENLAGKVANDSVALDLLSYAQSLKEASSVASQLSELKFSIVKYASNLPPSQRRVLLPILKAFKNQGNS